MHKNNLTENRIFLVSFFLRFGIAFTFIYAAIDGFLNPESWIGFIPQFASSIISPFLLLKIYGIYQIVLSLWLISNKNLFYSSLLTSITLIVIILPNISAMSIIFRDIAILCASLALLVMSYKSKS